MDTPFMDLQPHENSFGELAKCSETPTIFPKDHAQNIYWVQGMRTCGMLRTVCLYVERLSEETRDNEKVIGGQKYVVTQPDNWH